MTAALERHQLAAGRLRKRRALCERANEVGVAVDHERWAANSRAGVAETLGATDPESARRVCQRLGRRVERPADRVLDLLARVRLVDALREEELEELAV